MIRILRVIAIILAIAAVGVVVFKHKPVQSPGQQQVDQPTTETVKDHAKPFSPPLSRFSERVIKKYFGIYITPQNSPIQPERFHGYHTATDFEIFPDEVNTDVDVMAICDGTLLLKAYGTGYGGYAVQSCTLNSSPVTVVYGHLKLTSITLNKGAALKAGEKIGILGAGFTAETDGERKHLHLGIHKGSTINSSGYIANKADLAQWIDPMTVISAN